MISFLIILAVIGIVVVGGLFLMRRIDRWIKKAKEERLDVIDLTERKDP